MNLSGMLVELLDYSSLDESVSSEHPTAESVKLGVRYTVHYISVGKCAYFKHLSGEKFLRTSHLRELSVVDDIVEFTTRNTIYKFKIIDEGGI